MTDDVPPRPALRRELGTGDAVLVGLGAMLGAGVFSVFAPAAAAAGGALLLAVVLAALVAAANATSTAALAADDPRAGGAYRYGRRRLGPVWGFLAGWGFVVGKTASCAAMALVAGAYAWPDHARPVAAGAVVALTVVNLLGVTRTAAATRVLVAVTLVVLTTAVVASSGTVEPPPIRDVGDATAAGVLQAAALLFFAFAGYARVATLGEEVRDPARTIRVAVPLALGLVAAVYLVVGGTLLSVLGPDRLARSAAPLTELVTVAGSPGLAVVVRVGAVAACLGVLLSLLAGVSRTTLAMARDRELHPWLDAVSSRHGVPHRAEAAVGAVVLLLVLAVDLRDAVGFSSLAVLTYYGVANAAAWTLPGPGRGRRRAVAVAGLTGCTALVASLPPRTIAVGVLVLVSGLALRAARQRVRGRG